MSGNREMSDRLLTVAEAAELLRTSERFPRRLIAERRIRFTRIGRHVRIPESALRQFIAAGAVEPIKPKRERTALWPTRKHGDVGSVPCASFHRVDGKFATEGRTG
jgi:excisionase family DNA binding protein